MPTTASYSYSSGGQHSHHSHSHSQQRGGSSSGSAGAASGRGGGSGDGLAITRLVEQLSAHLLHGQPGQPPRESSSASSSRDLEGDAVGRAVKLSLRILGSSIAGTGPGARDEAQTFASIRRRLLTMGGPGGGGAANGGDFKDSTDAALRFQDLVRRLRTLNVLQSRWSVLRLLEELASSPAEPAAPRLPPPSAFLPPPPPQQGGGGFRDGSAALSRMGSATSAGGGGGGGGGGAFAPRGGPGRAVAAEAARLRSSGGGGGAGVLPEATERALLRDVLYALQGIDGRHVRYDAPSQAYLVDPALNLSPATRDLVLRTCEMGWLFTHVTAYVEATLAAGAHVGRVRLAFAQSLQDELTDYFRLLAVMEAQLGPADGSDDGGEGLTLRRLALWSVDPLERLRLMATLADAAGSLQGGALASCLHGHTAHGDPAVSSFVVRIMRRVCAPLFAAIRAWVCQGELDAETPAAGGSYAGGYGGGGDGGAYGADGGANDDFFVCCRSEVPEDGLWAERYYVNARALPSFIPAALADTILVAGKAINFMRAAAAGGDGGDGGWSAEDAAAAAAAAARLEYGQASLLQEVVARCAAATNAKALHLVMAQHALPSHLRALKKFLLLGQGDFVTSLLDNLGVELGKRASAVYHHNLSGIVDSALRGGAVQYEAPDLLDRVAVKLLDASHNETGWDVFSLCYTVQAPLTAVIHASAMLQYRRMFHLLWRIKRAEWVLAAAWRRHMSAAHAGVGGADAPRALRVALHSSLVLRAQMTHFAANLLQYMMFEVLEGSWQALQGALSEAADLDSVIAAHNSYLTKILDKAMLGPGPAAKAMLLKLHEVLRAIIDYCAHQETMLIQALAEVAAAREEAAAIDRRTAAGGWGTEVGRGGGGGSGHGRGGVQERTLTQLQETGRKYERAFSELLSLLEAESGRSEILRHLVFRLDFNGYYTRRAAAQAAASAAALAAGKAEEAQAAWAAYQAPAAAAAATAGRKQAPSAAAARQRQR